jgi:hypothetical protein
MGRGKVLPEAFGMGEILREEFSSGFLSPLLPDPPPDSPIVVFPFKKVLSGKILFRIGIFGMIDIPVHGTLSKIIRSRKEGPYVSDHRGAIR